MATEAPFWQRKHFSEMTQPEWESLCDGCGKCCLVKLQDEDSGETVYTNVACRYLNDHCRCSVYPDRLLKKPDCVSLNADDVAQFDWLPQSCAYRRLAEGRSLQDWHPLVSGGDQAIREAGHSMAGKVYNEDHIHPDDLEFFVIQWVDESI